MDRGSRGTSVSPLAAARSTTASADGAPIQRYCARTRCDGIGPLTSVSIHSPPSDGVEHRRRSLAAVGERTEVDLDPRIDRARAARDGGACAGRIEAALEGVGRDQDAHRGRVLIEV